MRPANKKASGGITGTVEAERILCRLAFKSCKTLWARAKVSSAATISMSILLEDCLWNNIWANRRKWSKKKTNWTWPPEGLGPPLSTPEVFLQTKNLQKNSLGKLARHIGTPSKYCPESCLPWSHWWNPRDSWADSLTTANLPQEQRSAGSCHKKTQKHENGWEEDC